MSKRAIAGLGIIAIALGLAAAPVTFQATADNGLTIAPAYAFARHGADDKAGHDAGDDKGVHKAGDDNGRRGRGADDKPGDDKGKGRGHGADDKPGDDKGKGRGHGADD